MSRGFTYIELLIAIVIAGLLALTAGSALLTSLRAERAAQAQREARFLLQSAATRAFLGLDPTGALEGTEAAWRVTPVEAPAARDTHAPRWRTWELAPADGGALRLRLSVQSEMSPGTNSP